MKKPYFSWYRGGLIIQSMCNHMETASHSSFIKPFIALIAVGALFYELLNNLAAHMYILGARSSQLSSRQLRGGGKLSARPPLGNPLPFMWGVVWATRRAVVSSALLGQARAECLKIEHFPLCFPFSGAAQMGFHLHKSNVSKVITPRLLGLHYTAGILSHQPIYQCLYQSLLLDLLASSAGEVTHRRNKWDMGLKSIKYISQRVNFLCGMCFSMQAPLHHKEWDNSSFTTLLLHN